MLCACSVIKAPLKPHLSQTVRSIEIAAIEVDRILLIRRVNPLFLVMGSSGLVADALVVASNASRYEASAGSVHKMCMDVFKSAVMQSISRQGIEVHSSNKRYWNYFKASQKDLRHSVDGLLRIRLSQMGFWSQAVVYGYFPSVLVDVTLIDPLSRDVLYSDQFSMGIDFTSVEVMALGVGKINRLHVEEDFSAYKNLNALLAHPAESRNDLLKVMAIAAEHIGQGLRRPALLKTLTLE